MATFNGPQICKLNMIGECKHLAGAQAHSFNIKSSGKPTMGMNGENIVISNAPKYLQRQVKPNILLISLLLRTPKSLSKM